MSKSLIYLPSNAEPTDRVAKLTPEMFKSLDFEHFYIQPKFDEYYNDNLRSSIKFCLKHPKWKLSLQSHKYVGIL